MCDLGGEQVEEIPGADAVSRHIDFPFRFSDAEDLIWENAFMFSGGTGESVIWRRDQPEIADVHALGCVQQARKRPAKPNWKYVGAITATVSTVRAIANRRGNGFEVEHHPEDGQGQHHAEIHRRKTDNPVLKSEKGELLMMLRDAFGPLEQHECPAI